MKETFCWLCDLYSFLSFCERNGNYVKAVDTARQIDETAKDHKVLNFFARHLYPFFV